MVSEPKRISFEDFARDPQRVFNDLRNHARPILVVYDDNLFRIEPANASEREPSGMDHEAAVQAIRASAGTLRGIDRDKLLTDLLAEREQNTATRG